MTLLFSKLFSDSGAFIAYEKIECVNPIASIVFFGGFMSDMRGIKAYALRSFCRKYNINLILFDYYGHGNSYGSFIDYGIDDWYKNCLDIVDLLTEESQIFIGMSMGAWLMWLITKNRTEKVKACISIAGSPDFTIRMRDTISADKLEILKKDGVVYLYDPAKDINRIISKKLFESGQSLSVMDKDPIKLDCPVRMIHGTSDMTVDYSVSMKMMSQIETNDLSLLLVKNADHSMNDEKSLSAMFNAIMQVI